MKKNFFFQKWREEGKINWFKVSYKWINKIWYWWQSASTKLCVGDKVHQQQSERSVLFYLIIECWWELFINYWKLKRSAPIQPKKLSWREIIPTPKSWRKVFQHNQEKNKCELEKNSPTTEGWREVFQQMNTWVKLSNITMTRRKGHEYITLNYESVGIII